MNLLQQTRRVATLEMKYRQLNAEHAQSLRDNRSRQYCLDIRNEMLVVAAAMRREQRTLRGMERAILN